MAAVDDQSIAPPRPGRPTRDDYVAWRTVTTRWRDDDAYGHLNNATYYELFDTAVNAHLLRGHRARTSGGCRRSAWWRRRRAATSARSASPSRSRPGWSSTGSAPPASSTGSACSRATPTIAAAEGRFVHVYVDNTDPARPVAPMPDVVRAAVEPLLRG